MTLHILGHRVLLLFGNHLIDHSHFKLTMVLSITFPCILIHFHKKLVIVSYKSQHFSYILTFRINLVDSNIDQLHIEQKTSRTQRLQLAMNNLCNRGQTVRQERDLNNPFVFKYLREEVQMYLKLLARFIRD